MASHPPRRRRSGRRHALGGVRAARSSRPRHRRRRARRRRTSRTRRPRYHGRDVAVVRAQQAGALVVLGSATPSLESSANARAGRYARVDADAARARPAAGEVRVVDMREELAAVGAEQRARPRRCVEAIGRRLADGEQSLVLLNRRGFATVIFCRECGATLECPHCSVTLTVHRAARRLRLPLLRLRRPLPPARAAMRRRVPRLSRHRHRAHRSRGAERFPDARIARVDRDTTRRRGAVDGCCVVGARRASTCSSARR